MHLLMFVLLILKQMIHLSLHQVWYHGGNMHTLLGEGYWIVMASVDGLLRRFVLDLQSWYVVKQFLVATSKLLSPDPRRIDGRKLRKLSLVPIHAGNIIIGKPVKYCYYCSAGIARTVYTISTCPKYLLLARRKYTYHYRHHDSSIGGGGTTAHARRNHSVQYTRSGHHCHFRVKGQLPYQTFSVPRDSYTTDPDEDGAVTPPGGCKLQLQQNRGSIPESHSHSIAQARDSIITSGTEAEVLEHMCRCHVLGEDPKYHSVLRQHNTRMSLYRKLPWKTISRLYGQLHNLELPVWLRSPALRLYIWLFKCKLHEALDTDLRNYRNLSEFFRRTLRPGLRPIADAHILTSAADGTMMYLGQVENGVLEQVKGIAYSLRGFMGPKGGLLFQRYLSLPDDEFIQIPSDAAYARSLLSNPKDNALYHCVTYLAPGDYHRFHSPADWTVCARRHFPGELFSVHPGISRWLQGLFNYNERAVYTGRWNHGFFSMTAVGATNVGSINVSFDKDLFTNCPEDRKHEVFYDAEFSSKGKEGVHVKKGQLIGEFNLGSTIVLIFEAPKKFKFNVKVGQTVKYGQGIGFCQKRNRKQRYR